MAGPAHQRQLCRTVGTRGILDLEVMARTLYERQEEIRADYNPMNPERSSHVCQALNVSAVELIVNLDVKMGNQTASQYARPTLGAGWLPEKRRTSRRYCVETSQMATRRELPAPTRVDWSMSSNCGRLRQ